MQLYIVGEAAALGIVPTPGPLPEQVQVHPASLALIIWQPSVVKTGPGSLPLPGRALR